MWARQENAQKKWDRFSSCKQRSGHYEMVTAALCLWEVCHLREIPSGENMTAFRSTCAATGEWAREPGFRFAREEGDVRDEWQMGKRLLTHVHPREQKPCTGCVVCTQFDDLRVCPQSTGTHVKKCKTVASIAYGNIQKVTSRWEWAANRFTFPNSPSTSTETSWKGGWVWEEREHCLRCMDEGGIACCSISCAAGKLGWMTRKTFPAEIYMSMQSHVSKGKEINL